MLGVVASVIGVLAMLLHHQRRPPAPRRTGRCLRCGDGVHRAVAGALGVGDMGGGAVTEGAQRAPASAGKSRCPMGMSGLRQGHGWGRCVYSGRPEY
jgi:hypothetical protein